MSYSGLVRADLHNFIRTFSGSNPNDLGRVVDIVSERLGRGGIVGITSCEDTRYEDLLKTSGPKFIDRGNAIYFPDRDVWIVKGQLFNAKYGEDKCQFLALGLKKDEYLPGRFEDLAQTLEKAKGMNLISVLYAPFGGIHPIGPVISQNTDIMKYFSAINTFHGEIGEEANKKAKDICPILKRNEINIGALAFSGAHSFSGIGTSYTILPRMNPEDINSPEDVVANLRQGILRSAAIDSPFKEQYLPFDALKHKIKLGAYIALSKINEKSPNKLLSELLDKMAKSQLPFFKL
ncbi:hypothetical protein HYT26_02745 [Candidatus Pacearchaeota archaeon]|nr:hypothetical protein [Candidatus Pacearchaeota archaeon]